MEKKNMIEMVREFHEAFNHPVSNRPTLSPEGQNAAELHDLRVKLIQEELDELKEGLATNNIVEVADAISDLLYVVIGAGIVYGIPMETVFDEVHRSNMTKLGPDGKPLLNGVNCPLDPARPVGKVVKGPNYTPPNVGAVLGR